MRQAWPKLEKSLAQPDWALAFAGCACLACREEYGERLPVSWGLALLVFCLVAILNHFWLFRKADDPSWSRGKYSWLIVILPLCWAISQTGGLESPLLYFSVAALLHCLEVARKMRIILVTSVVLLPASLHLVFDHPLLVGGTIKDFTEAIYPILLLIGLLGCYCMVFAEYHPIETDIFLSGAQAGPAFLDTESLLRATLGRAIKLYRADGGFVALLDENATGWDANKPPSRLVKCYEVDIDSDKLVQKGSELCGDHIAYIAAIEGNATRHTLKPREVGTDRRACSEFAFALTRFRGSECFAIVCVYSRRRYAFPFPFTYKLGIMRGEASLVYEMLLHTASYRALLLAKNTSDFQSQLLQICDRLVPPFCRPPTVHLKLSNRPISRSGALVPIYRTLSEPRVSPRFVSVSADMKQPNVGSVETIKRFLAYVASAPLLHRIVETEARIEASGKEPVGLANLEPPDEERLKRLIDDYNAELPKNPKGAYEKAFTGLGFPLLWANHIMRAWNPLIDDFEPESRPPGSGLQPGIPLYCYHYFNSIDQRCVCGDCPVLALLIRYVKAHGAERKAVAQSIEVRTSHSPSGQANMIRHFELAASIVLNPLSPGEINFVRETATDRTLQIEELAIITGTAKVLDLFVIDHADGEEAQQKRYETTLRRILGIAAEGLGRSFQAKMVLRVELGGNGHPARLLDRFQYVPSSQNEMIKINADEMALLDTARGGGGGILQYFEDRRNLFESRLSEPTFVPEHAAEVIRRLARLAGNERAAQEIMPQDGKSAQCLFDWEELHKIKRCLVLSVAHSDFALIICTRDPEKWELESQEGRPLPRNSERQSCQSIGDMIGFLSRALAVASEYAASLVASHIREMLHELSFLFVSMPRHVRHIRAVMQRLFTTLPQIDAAIANTKIYPYFAQWYSVIQNCAFSERELSGTEQRNLASEFAATVCPEGDAAVNPAFYRTLAKAGIRPTDLPGFAHVGSLPAATKSVLLDLLAHLITAFRAFGHLSDCSEESRVMFESILGRKEIRQVNIMQCARRITGLFELKAPEARLRYDIPTDLTANIDRSCYELIMMNLIRNAYEAIRRGPGSFQEICISATTDDSFLVTKVINPPPLIKAGRRAKIFERGYSDKSGSGTGLCVARERAREAGGDIYYRVKNGENVFTARLPILRS